MAREKRICLHEAGHLVLAWAIGLTPLGAIVREIDGRDGLASVGLEKDSPPVAPSLWRAVLSAGELAAAIFSDVELSPAGPPAAAGNLAMLGITPQSVSESVNDRLAISLSLADERGYGVTAEELEIAIAEAEDFAGVVLLRNRVAMLKIAERLYRDGEIMGIVAMEILRDFGACKGAEVRRQMIDDPNLASLWRWHALSGEREKIEAWAA